MTAHEELPEKIGKYEVLGIAGEGAMGVVYLGHDPFFDRDVAIKTSRVHGAPHEHSKVAHKMLYNEARAASALDHGAILQIYDAGEHLGEPYVVMEYVADARTLKEFSRPDTLLPIERVVEIMHVCAKALDYAHRRGVIHRDIKSSNIMLTPDGGVKIGDFGIAKFEHVDISDFYGTVGSPRFMSPEQLLDLPVTPATDIYSLGVVMYELLTGHTAFDGNSYSQLMAQVLTQTPRPLRALRAEVPPELEAVVNKAMQKKQERRYGSGAELAADLAVLHNQLAQPLEDLAPEEKLALVRSLRFFNDFADSEIQEVVGASQWVHYKPGERIIREGNMESYFYILVSGDVAVSKGGKRVGTLSKGSCFGEMSFLSRITRTASIYARDDVNVMRIESAIMDRLSFTTQRRFSQAFMQILVDRLASTTERLSKFLD